MKRILTILFVLISVAGFSQITPFNRGSTSILARDAHEQGYRTLIMPVLSDTSAYIGVDSLGAFVYSKSDGLVYYKDTIDGGHRWIAFGYGLITNIGWQTTLDNLSILDKDNYVDVAGYEFDMNHANGFRFSAGDDDTLRYEEAEIAIGAQTGASAIGIRTQDSNYQAIINLNGTSGTVTGITSDSTWDVRLTTMQYPDSLSFEFDNITTSNPATVTLHKPLAGHYFVPLSVSVNGGSSSYADSLGNIDITAGGSGGSDSLFGIQDDLGIQNRFNNFQGFNLELDSVGNFSVYGGDINFSELATQLSLNGFSTSLYGQLNGNEFSNIVVSAASNQIEIGSNNTGSGARSVTTLYPDSITSISDDATHSTIITQTKDYVKFHTENRGEGHEADAVKIIVTSVIDSLNVVSPTRIAVWDNDTLKSAAFSGGGSQGLQDVITVDNVLTKNDTITGGSTQRRIFWDSLKHYINMSANVSEAINTKLNIGVGTNEGAFKVTSSRNAAYYQMYDDNSAGNGGLDAINIKSFNKDGTQIYWLSGRWLQYGTTAPVQLANAQVTVNNSGSTKSLNLSSNTIQSWNDDLVFNDLAGITNTENARIKTTGQIQGTKFYPNSDISKFLTTDGSGNFVLSSSTAIVASADSVAQSVGVSSIATYTPSSNGTFRIGGYINVTAIVTNVITLKVTYTDINSNAVTQIIPLTLAATGAVGTTATVVGNNSATDIQIRAKSGSAITVLTTATGVGSELYDVGCTIERLR